MKSLSAYITESMINESSHTFVKFSLYNDDKSVDAINSIVSYCYKKNIYIEKLSDNVFKIKAKEGMNVDEIINILNNLIENLPEEKKEEVESQTEKIKDTIEKLKEATLVKEPKEKNEKEEKNEEEE